MSVDVRQGGHVGQGGPLGFAEGAALANMATLADIDAHRQAATTVAQHAEAYYRDRA